ncbi:hypothetical protein [Streptomyces cellostaticus]|uniref:hypothetical protein n=1 Tax=Streptomyces TaxID=1883 RepID=UPI00202767F5|nr:hypothetical protein [Streptomyces cellostaticus]
MTLKGASASGQAAVGDHRQGHRSAVRHLDVIETGTDSYRLAHAKNRQSNG